MLNQITATEKNLIATARATTAALDAVATGSLDDAIADLEHAALAAGDRLESAASRYVAALSGLVARLSGVAGMLASVSGAPGDGAPETPALPDAPTIAQETTSAEDDAEPDSPPADISDAAEDDAYIAALAAGEVPLDEDGYPCRWKWQAERFDAPAPSDEMLATVRAELDAWDTMDGVTVAEGESHRLPDGTVEHVAMTAANPGIVDAVPDALVSMVDTDGMKAHARRLLLTNPEKSNREIARLTGLSKDAVRKLRNCD